MGVEPQSAAAEVHTGCHLAHWNATVYAPLGIIPLLRSNSQLTAYRTVTLPLVVTFFGISKPQACALFWRSIVQRLVMRVRFGQQRQAVRRYRKRRVGIPHPPLRVVSVTIPASCTNLERPRCLKKEALRLSVKLRPHRAVAQP